MPIDKIRPSPVRTNDAQLNKAIDLISKALKSLHDFGVVVNDSGDIVINKDIHCRSIYVADNSVYIGGIKLSKPKDGEDGYYLQYDKASKKFTYQATASPITEQVQDIVGAMTTGNTETFIAVTYQDGDGTIDFVVPVLDEDDMATDSAAYLATQQSIKAYSDTVQRNSELFAFFMG